MTIPAAVRTFGREKLTFARERAVGANVPAYYIGKLSVDLLLNFFYVFVFLAPMIAVAPWRSPIELIYITLICLTACMNSIAYALSFLIDNPGTMQYYRKVKAPNYILIPSISFRYFLTHPCNIDDAVLAGTILCVLFNLFGGFVPRLGDGFLGLISYTRYSARAIVNVELIHGHGIESKDLFHTLVPEAWREPNLSMDLGTLLIIASVVNVFSYGLLEFKFYDRYIWQQTVLKLYRCITWISPSSWVHLRDEKGNFSALPQIPAKYLNADSGNSFEVRSDHELQVYTKIGDGSYD